MKTWYALLVSLAVVGCATRTSKTPSAPAADTRYTATDADYGYSASKPVELGGFLTGSKYSGAHAEYFENLVGPHGEPVSVERLGSCCAFEDESLPFGGGLLDMYQLSYEGQDKPVVIYVNLYRFARPLAPVGFALL